MVINKERQPLLNRHFTRGEVVKQFLEDFGPSYAEFDQTLVVSSVYLFIEFKQPAWQVNFKVQEQGSTVFRGKEVYVEKKERGVPVLVAAVHLELPSQATTLAEEDEAILAHETYPIFLRNRGLL